MALPQIIYTTSAKLNTIAVKDGQIIFTKDTKLLYADIDTTRININSSSTGATGTKGNTGSTGGTGPAGTAATISIGTISVGAAGGNATVTNSGSNSAAVLNFTIPKGADGAKGLTGDKGNAGGNGSNGTNASITIGTVSTGNAGTNVIISNVGNATTAKFNFTIPRGATGDTGPKGDRGPDGYTGSDGYSMLDDYDREVYTLYNGITHFVELYVYHHDHNDVPQIYLDLCRITVNPGGEYYEEFFSDSTYGDGYRYDEGGVLNETAECYVDGTPYFYKSGLLYDDSNNGFGEYYIEASPYEIYIVIMCHSGKLTGGYYL